MRCSFFKSLEERDAIDPTKKQPILPPQRKIQSRTNAALLSKLNRRERVHRLCTRAGMLESFLVCPGELTDDQVMELLKISFRQPEVVLALAKMVHDVHERSNVQNPLE